MMMMMMMTLNNAYQQQLEQLVNNKPPGTYINVFTAEKVTMETKEILGYIE